MYRGTRIQELKTTDSCLTFFIIFGVSILACVPILLTGCLVLLTRD